jgi:hypothetical protein
MNRQKRTSISRPESRNNTSTSQCNCATSGSHVRLTALASFNSASTDRVLFLTGRLRGESHQTSVGIKRVALLCDRPGGGCRPRETSVPSRVQGVACTARGYRRVDDASPLVAHGLGDSAICIHADGTRAASKSLWWIHTSPLTWLTAPGQTVTRSIDSHRTAAGLAACSNKPAPACAPAP